MLVEFIDVSPEIVENCFSSGSATAEAIVSGLAPGSDALTEIVGKSMAGRSLTGRSRYDITPKTTMPSTMSVVVIGRLMNSAEIFMSPPSDPVPPLTEIRLPGTSRSWPSVTTVSPGFTPFLENRFFARGARDGHGADVNRLIALHDEDVLPLRPVLHRDRGHDNRPRIGGEPHRHVHELAGPEAPVRVREGRLDSDGAGGLIDGVVDERDLSDCRRRGFIRRGRLDLERLLSHVSSKVRQQRLGNAERRQDGRHLIDDDERKLIVGAHEVAGVHHERAGSSGDRRTNRRVLKLNFRIFHGGSVGSDDRLQRRGGGARRVALFAGSDTAFDEIVHALCDHLGVGSLRRIALQVRFCLVERGFERTRIQRKEHLAGLDVLTLAEIDRLELARHLGPDGHGRIGLDGADDLYVERHFLLEHRRDGHGNRGLGPAGARRLGIGPRTRRKYGQCHGQRKEQAKGNTWELAILAIQNRLNSVKSMVAIL